ncbi:MAG: protein kinase [Ruminococcus sp.]|nr:protein kinase [Ruminococcus sp.]MDE6672097.1 protein kinase [Ruminococcus sp.]
MAEYLTRKRIETEFGGIAQINGVIGKGRQSIVYRVETNTQKKALKWYDTDKIKNIEQIHENIRRNIVDGKPDRRFLWPEYTTITDNSTGAFGYFMELRTDDFEYFADVVRGYKFVINSETGNPIKKKVRFSSLYAMITTVINIIDSFRQINALGKSFQGLSEGSFFINTDTGEILVSDCDTIAPYGTDLDIKIRSEYKAPEVIMGKLPDEKSDMYSLALILFRLLFRGDAFEGEKTVMDVCLNEKEIAKHYSTDAVFIYDPDNNSNRALNGIHDNVIKFWNEYPEYIKEAFTYSFTVGINNPEKRIRFEEWLNLFVRLRTEILCCMCGKSSFISMNASPEDEVFVCPVCNLKYASMKFTDRLYRMPLCIGGKIFACDLDPSTDDLLTVDGEIVENKIRKGLMGIKNHSRKKWSVFLPDGMYHDVEYSKGFPVWQGLKIDFGKIKAEL